MPSSNLVLDAVSVRKIGAHARLAMATRRARLDLRILPSCTARFTRPSRSKMMSLAMGRANRSITFLVFWFGQRQVVLRENHDL